MYEANANEFKPIDGVLPETMFRFNIDKVTYKDKKYKNSEILRVVGGVSVVCVAFLVMMGWNTNEEADKETQLLAEISQQVNTNKTILTKKDLTSDSPPAEVDFITDKVRKAYLATNPNMSAEEKRLLKLTPDFDILIPDQQN